MRFSVLVCVSLLAAVILFAACGGEEEKLPEQAAVTLTAAAEATQTATPSAPTPTAAAPSPTVRVTATPSPAAQEIAVVGSGFSIDEEGYYSYGVILANLSTGKAAERVDINIGFYDEGGGVVATESDTVAVIFPGQRAAVAGFSSTEGARPVQMKVQVRPTDWSSWDKAKPDFATTNVGVTPREYSGLVVTGEVANPFTKDLEDVKLVAIFYDAAGNITGGASTYQDFIPAGTSSPFEITSFSEAPAARAEVFAQMSFLTLSAFD